MFSTAALVTFVALGAADLTGAAPTIGDLPPLSMHATAQRSVIGTGALALRSDLLDSADRPRSLRGSAFAQTAPATASAAPAASEAAPTDAAAAPAEEEPSIDLMRHREHLVRVHRPLGIAAWATLLLTEVAGTVLALNRPTLFGSGACPGTENPGSQCLLGDFGGAPLSTFHELSAFITLGFYTSTGIFALGMPDPEHASVGNDHRAGRLRWHKRMAVVHLIGMILEPILGIIAYEPGLIGLSGSPHHRGDSYLGDPDAWLRTIHMGVGVITFAALSSAMLLELLP